MGKTSSSPSHKWVKTQLQIIRYYIPICILMFFFSCKIKEKDSVNINFSFKELDSILEKDNYKNKFPLFITKNKNQINFQIISHGEKGDFGGDYADGELDSPVFFIKTSSQNRVIDSLEIYKKVIGEGTYFTKLFNITGRKLEVLLSEEWEDYETGIIEKLDSIYVYDIGDKGLITLVKKDLIAKPRKEK